MRNRWFACFCVAAVLFPTLEAAGAVRARRIAPTMKVETSGEKISQVTFTGKVLDGQGRPIPGASVVRFQMTYDGSMDSRKAQRTEEITTGADGAFTFTAPKDSESYRESSILVHKEGLAWSWVAWRMRESQQSDVTLGEPKELAGEVVDENSGPMPEAEVSIALAIIGKEEDRRYLTSWSAPDVLTTKTDDTGRFVFASMPAEATFEFLVKKPGRATVCTMPASFRGEKCQFSAGQTGIKIAQPPEAVIKGVLLEKAGSKPVGGVPLMAQPVPRSVPFPLEPVASGPDGTFSFGGLAAGTYAVQLQPPGQKIAEWIAEPVEVSVQAGETKSDVKLQLAKGSIIEVRVKESASGKPVEKASVSIHDSQRDQWAGHQTDPNGLARIRVVPGSYEIAGAYKEGYTRQRQQQQQQVEIADGETKQIECTLTAAPRVTGTVRDETGNPLGGVLLAIKPSSPEEKTTDSDGRFEVSWDPSDWGPDNTTFVLVARDVARNLGAVVDLDEQTSNLDVKLQPGIVFTGKVLNHEGKPLADARLQVMLRVSNWGSSIDGLRGERKQTSGPDGTFEIKAIPPERQYQVTATAEGYGKHDVEVDAYNAKDGRMELGEFKLPLADLSVSGVVVDANDQPVAGADIYAYGRNQPDRSNIQTDSQGKFVLQNVCAGQIQLNANVRRANYQYGYVTTEGGATDVKIVVSERSSGQTYVPRKPQPLVGKPLPELKNVGIELPADANDRMLLVCLWDMNQRPSRYCMTQLAQRAAQLTEKGVVVVALQAVRAEPAAVTQWLEKNKIACQAGCLTGDVEKARFAWGAVALPHLILTDKKHIVIAEGFTVDELYAMMRTGVSR